jgi:hypothetical protein
MLDVILIAGTAGDSDILDSIAINIIGIDAGDNNWYEPGGTSTWSLSWNSSLHPNGEYVVNAIVNSTDDRSVSSMVNITVNNTGPVQPPPVNQPPKAEIIDGPSNVTAGENAEFEIEVSDPDGIDDISSVWMTISISDSTILNDTVSKEVWSSGPFTYEVDTADMNGTYTLEVTVVDTHGDIVNDEWNFTIQPPEDNVGPDGPDASGDAEDETGIELMMIAFIGIVLVVGVSVLLSRRKRIKS